MDKRFCIIPVYLGKTVHLHVELPPHVEEVVQDVLVLMAIDVSEIPCQAAVCKFPADLMNEVMMGLFRSVVSVFKDCNKAGLAVTTYFNGAVGDVVECGNGFCDDNNCKDAATFAAVWVNIVRVTGVTCAPMMREVRLFPFCRTKAAVPK